VRTPSPRARGAEMMGGMIEDGGWRRLTIELDGPPSEPSGWVSSNEGARTPFDGWLQLLAALEHAIGAEQEQRAKDWGGDPVAIQAPTLRRSPSEVLIRATPANHRRLPVNHHSHATIARALARERNVAFAAGVPPGARAASNEAHDHDPSRYVRSTRRFVLAAAVIVSSLALVPAVAAASPALRADRACYRPGDPIALSASAFTPSAPIGFIFQLHGDNGSKILASDHSPKADATGALTATYRAPDLASSDDRREELFISANDQSKLGPNGPIGPPEDSFAHVSTRLSQWDVLADTWMNGRADPHRVVHLRAFGWTHEKTLWAHYFLGTKRIKSVRIGAVQGPCGDLTKRIRQFPFRPVAAGAWTIRFTGAQVFDKRDMWISYRVRVPTDKAIA
jgi:hypothetical protein